MILVGFEFTIGVILALCTVCVVLRLAIAIRDHSELVVLRIKQVVPPVIVLGVIAGFLVAYPSGLAIVPVALVIWGFVLRLRGTPAPVKRAGREP